MNEIDFLNEKCKNDKHNSCYGSWLGLGFKFICECRCHKEKNTTSKDFSRRNSVTRCQFVVGESID